MTYVNSTIRDGKIYVKSAIYLGMANQSREIDFIMAVGLRLKAARIALDMNQAKLCEAIGVAPNTYSQWESGDRMADPVAMTRLCQRFSLTMDWVYRGTAACLPMELANKILSAHNSILAERHTTAARQKPKAKQHA